MRLIGGAPIDAAAAARATRCSWPASRPLTRRSRDAGQRATRAGRAGADRADGAVRRRRRCWPTSATGCNSPICGWSAQRRDPAGDNVFEIVDGRSEPIARFAWTPQRPGAEILDSVVPFIGIALAGFALLAGLVLRYMRRTAATIAAGENRLRYLALHDPLCGLPNRNFFGERLEAVIAEVKRGGAPAAVFYIDLDHFKDVNDTLGHPIGDELIRNVTLRLSRIDARRRPRGAARRRRIRRHHRRRRPTTRRCRRSPSRIIATLCAPYSINGHTIVIGASIGIAVIDQRSDGGAADIMRYADMALYRAKNEGRNRACIYDAVMDADLSQRKLVEQDLREAIENDGLKVLYQPIVNASGEKVVGVEALARWPHPTRGVISPAEFIPIAEHSGLIIELGAQRAAPRLPRRQGLAGHHASRSTSRRCSSASSISSAWSSASWRRPASIRRGSSSNSPKARCSATSKAPRPRCGG